MYKYLQTETRGFIKRHCVQDHSGGSDDNCFPLMANCFSRCNKNALLFTVEDEFCLKQL